VPIGPGLQPDTDVEQRRFTALPTDDRAQRANTNPGSGHKMLAAKLSIFPCDSINGLRREYEIRNSPSNPVVTLLYEA
jgi:hypothetical protein